MTKKSLHVLNLNPFPIGSDVANYKFGASLCCSHMWWSLATWDPQIYGGTLPQRNTLGQAHQNLPPWYVVNFVSRRKFFLERWDLSGFFPHDFVPMTIQRTAKVGVQAYLALHDRSRVVNAPSGGSASYVTVRRLRINKNDNCKDFGRWMEMNIHRSQLFWCETQRYCLLLTRSISEKAAAMAGGELWKEMVRLTGVQGNPGPIWEQSFKDGPLVPFISDISFMISRSVFVWLITLFQYFSLVLVFKPPTFPPFSA